MSSLVEVAAVRAIGITKRYGAGQAAVTALDNVTVALPAARFTAIMGRSGSGKSTLLHCLAGLDTVDAGVVYLGDVDLTGRSERELTRLRRDRVGFVFQAYNLLPTLTAGENLLLPVRIAHRTPDRDWIDRVVEAVGLRGGARGYVTKAISGPELCEAIRRVHAGDVYFSPRLAVFVLDSFRGADATETHPDLDRLTRRERDVLRLVASGYTYQEVGTRLAISARTVESHASAVLRKLQLSNRRELSRWARADHLA